jgi:hypothetical protein
MTTERELALAGGVTALTLVLVVVVAAGHWVTLRPARRIG